MFTKFKTKLLIFLVGIPFIITACSSDPVTSNKFYEEGTKFLENREYSKALEQFKLATNDEPAFSESYLKAAHILILKKDYAGAKDLLNSAVGYADNQAAVFSLLADIYFQEQDYDQALTNYSKALEYSNYEENALIGKLHVLLLKGEIEIVQTFTAGLDQDQLSPEFLTSLALVKFNIGGAEVNELLTRVQNSDSDLKELAEVLINLNNVTAEDPETRLTNFAQAVFESQNAGMFIPTLPLLAEMISLNEYYESSFLYRGNIYMVTQDYQKALADLEKALTINSENADIKLAYAQAAFFNNQPDLALAQINTIAFNNDQQNLLATMRILLSFEQYETMTHILESIDYTQHTNKLELDVYKIVGLTETERYTDALSLGEQVQLETLDNEAKGLFYTYMGYANFKNGAKAKGLEMIQSGRQFVPYDSKSFYFEGLIYLDQEDYFNARQALERAADLDFEHKLPIKETLDQI